MVEPVPARIVLDGVTKSYGGIRALDGMTLTVEPGQFVAVVGRSGAGKTTLLRCLSGAAVVTEGSIRFDNEDLSGLGGRRLVRHRARIGMIFQQFNLVKRLRVVDNVLVGRLSHLAGWRRWAALGWWFDPSEREIALRCLAYVGLLDRAWQRTDTLSGGEQQRVAIAKVLAQSPQLILADEPVASLDVANGTLVMETLRSVASRAGLTVIATLHQVEAARRYADRILGFRRGRLVFDAPPARLDNEALERIFGAPPAETRAVATEAVGVPLWVLR